MASEIADEPPQQKPARRHDDPRVIAGTSKPESRCARSPGATRGGRQGQGGRRPLAPAAPAAGWCAPPWRPRLGHHRRFRVALHPTKRRWVGHAARSMGAQWRRLRVGQLRATPETRLRRVVLVSLEKVHVRHQRPLAPRAATAQSGCAPHEDKNAPVDDPPQLTACTMLREANNEERVLKFCMHVGAVQVTRGGGAKGQRIRRTLAAGEPRHRGVTPRCQSSNFEGRALELLLQVHFDGPRWGTAAGRRRGRDLPGHRLVVGPPRAVAHTPARLFSICRGAEGEHCTARGRHRR